MLVDELQLIEKCLTEMHMMSNDEFSVLLLKEEVSIKT